MQHASITQRDACSHGVGCDRRCADACQDREVRLFLNRREQCAPEEMIGNQLAQVVGDVGVTQALVIRAVVREEDRVAGPRFGLVVELLNTLP